METLQVMYRCGDYPWVPLIGLSGVVAHAPVMVMRQLGTEQFVPDLTGLKDFGFDYGTPFLNQKTIEAAKAWKKRYMMDIGWFTQFASPEYRKWIMSRGRKVLEPKASEHRLIQELTDVQMLEEEFERERKQWMKDTAGHQERIAHLSYEVREGNFSQKRLQITLQETQLRLAKTEEECDKAKQEAIQMNDLREFADTEAKECRKDAEFIMRQYQQEKQRNRELGQSLREAQKLINNLQAKAMEDEQTMEGMIAEMFKLRKDSRAKEVVINELQTKLQAESSAEANKRRKIT